MSSRKKAPGDDAVFLILETIGSEVKAYLLVNWSNRIHRSHNRFLTLFAIRGGGGGEKEGDLHVPVIAR